MQKTRIIARLDVKGPKLIKGVQLEGLRVLGEPKTFAEKYYQDGADELLFIDLVASLYGRSKLTEIVAESAKNIFVPLTVGGGIRTLGDIDEMLRSGADKVAINTAAVKNPQFFSEAAKEFGSQCVVASIEAKQRRDNIWEVYTECGREPSGIDVSDWASQLSDLGAGEILLTSIDREGTRQGFDLNLTKTVSANTKLPIISSGGFGSCEDISLVVSSGADAIAVADSLHYNRHSLADIRDYCLSNNIPVRRPFE